MEIGTELLQIFNQRNWYFSWGLKKVVRLKQCPIYGFHLEMREREAYRK